MSYQCELREQPAQPTLAIRTRTSVQNLPQVIGKAFGDIAQYLAQLGQYPAGAPFAAYHNMDMQDLDVELGFPVPKDLPGKGEIKAGHIPGGKFGVVIHTGPYDKIGPAYEALTKWIADKGYEVTGVAYEYYLNDPDETKPEDLKTQVVFPLK
ncbi:GyrI-like domain-containing protein [Candidatus Fermentibacteria bacterium]|nr:GyrI-like domain-containing protein [Candidatus Fermentibacteria bacterium]